MKNLLFLILISVFLLSSCTKQIEKSKSDQSQNETNYFDNTGRDDILSGGVKMIKISTPKGNFKVWTKRVGNNPKIKVLLLHGGPGSSHRVWTIVDSYFPGAGIEYYYYDQLGSFFSDNPKDTSLWTLERFVEEVEQVRKALGLNNDNFYLLGSSWGGILATEYAIKYQKNLKGLIICSALSSMQDYNEYVNEVLAKTLNPKDLAEIRELEKKEDFNNPRYIELLNDYYAQFVIRLPAEQIPEPVSWTMQHINREIYELMQGPSEFGLRGRLANWNRNDDLKDINVPTLVVGSKYNTMDPEKCEWMAGQIPLGEYLYCPNGSHVVMYDDAEVFFDGLISFIKKVDNEKDDNGL